MKNSINFDGNNYWGLSLIFLIFRNFYSLSKQRSGTSEIENDTEEFTSFIAKLSSFGANYRRDEAIRLFCMKKNLSIPNRSVRRRWIKLCKLKHKRPIYEFGVKYENAQKWKSTIVKRYGKTNDEIMKEALEKDWEIFNMDETQVAFERFNENYRVRTSPFVARNYQFKRIKSR